jgi:thymidylate synthase (FAD)
MEVSLVSMTQPFVEGVKTPEELIVYCARVSSPNNQHNHDTAPRLLAYLIKHKHWSPFEQVDMCVAIKTSRAIAAQLLRHWSFSFQEFSLRYAVSTCEFEPQEIRFKGATNRQGSVEASAGEQKAQAALLGDLVQQVQNHCAEQYQSLINQGVAPEVARMVLPLGLTTHLYMKGSIRDWIHYLDLRTADNTQKEHREIALSCRTIFENYFPNIAGALALREVV